MIKFLRTLDRIVHTFGNKNQLSRIYPKSTVRLVEANAVTIMDYGIVQSNTQAFETAAKIQADGVDLIFCNFISYANSSVFAPIVQNTNAPIVLLALQPRKHLDYSKASTFMQLETECCSGI